MKSLIVYPTSRAIRNARKEYIDNDALLPHMMRMDEFEQRCIVIDGRSMVDTLQRVLLLRKAADFEEFGAFGIDRTLVKFLSNSESFVRFFEELAVEHRDLSDLAEADAYAEFGKHLDVLSKLRSRYRDLLDERGLYDRMFIPQMYSFNDGFVSQYDQIDIYIEGLLSKYEMELLEKVAETTKLLLHYAATPFSAKMIESFAQLGITLEKDHDYTIDMSQKRVIAQTPLHSSVDATVISVQERFEQVSAALVAIEEMVSSGIDPDRIALVLPDESFKEAFRLYDKLNNLNFAMGFDYANGRNYKILDTLAVYLRSQDKDTLDKLARYGIDMETLEQSALSQSSRIDAETFFAALGKLPLSENDPLRQARVEGAKEEFARVFDAERLTPAEWLYLWLSRLSDIRIDDLRGGRITVMGVLETRGVSFDGVVIVDFNEGIVPASSAKDQFLNTQVRAFAGLPTKADRESLQKHYYQRLLSQAQKATIIYSSGDNKLPSKFLYELGLESAKTQVVRLDLLYDQPSRIVEESDPIVSDFDPKAYTWSATRLGIWLSCKRKFYYKYIRGVESKPDNGINEGVILHKVLERLYLDKDHFDDAKMMREYLYREIDLSLPDDTPRAEYYKILWRRKLESFIEHELMHFCDGWRVYSTEQVCVGKVYGFDFEGRIDRIDIRDGEAMVIDYKSGSLAEANRTKHLENATDFQMNIYRHLLSKRYPDAIYAFQKILDGGELEEAKALDEKEEHLAMHIEELSQTHEFIATKTDKLAQCKYCEYALMCGRGEYL